MKGLLIALFCLAHASTAKAANWIYLTESATDTVISVDIDSIKTEKIYSGTIVRAWFLSDHSKDRTVKKRETKALEEFKCNERTQNISYFVEYDASGNVIYNGKGAYNDFRPVVPDSVGEAKLNFVCTFSGELAE